MKEQQELKEYIISTINNLYENSNGPNPTIVVIGNITACKTVADALEHGDTLNFTTVDTYANIKIDYTFTDIAYDKYTIKYVATNWNDNNFYIIPCDRV